MCVWYDCQTTVALAQVGVDISTYASNALSEFRASDFDVVISCCGCGAKLDTDDKEAWKEQVEGTLHWTLRGG